MLKKILPLVLLISSCAVFSPNPNRDKLSSDAPMELKPFTSDYCSDFPEGTTQNPTLWADCCFSHDMHYWIGGTEKERINSDKVLRECVKKTGSKFDAFLMYIGVRMGGNPGDASYSWGYGWSLKRDYIEIPPHDIEQSITLLKTSEYYQSEKNRMLIDAFIGDNLEKRLTPR